MSLRLRLKAWLFLMVMTTLIHLIPRGYAMKAANRLVRHVARSPKLGSLSPEEITQAAMWASKYVPGTTCLIRSLAVQAMLERAGYRTTLHFGVKRPAPGRIEAHAWVEMEGKVVFTTDDLEGYARLLPPANAPKGDPP